MATVSPINDQHAAKTGDRLTYTYLVTNTGNIDLASVVVSDPSLRGVSCPVPTPPGLPPEAWETCTADDTYTVTGADVQAGKDTETATATGTDDHGTISPTSRSSTATVHTASGPSGLGAISTDLGRWVAVGSGLGRGATSAGGAASLGTAVPGTHPPGTAPIRNGYGGVADIGSSGSVLIIPGLGVRAPILPKGAVGTPGTASLVIPSDIAIVGWWDGDINDGGNTVVEKAPAPGQPGVAVIAGHLGAAGVAPGALYRISDLRQGDTILVRDSTGWLTSWVVSSTPRTATKTAMPASLWVTTGRPRLALVTRWRPFRRRYRPLRRQRDRLGHRGA